MVRTPLRTCLIRDARSTRSWPGIRAPRVEPTAISCRVQRYRTYVSEHGLSSTPVLTLIRCGPCSRNPSDMRTTSAPPLLGHIGADHGPSGELVGTPRLTVAHRSSVKEAGRRSSPNRLVPDARNNAPVVLLKERRQQVEGDPKTAAFTCYECGAKIVTPIDVLRQMARDALRTGRGAVVVSLDANGRYAIASDTRDRGTPLDRDKSYLVRPNRPVTGGSGQPSGTG